MHNVEAQWSLLTLPARHWKWHARACVLYWLETQQDTLHSSFDLVFASSLVPICELKTFVPSLARVPTVVYCHENQFTYPNQSSKVRDHHYAFTEMVNLRAADAVVFNSAFNRDSFLKNARLFLTRMPAFIPIEAVTEIANKASVIPLVLEWPTGDIQPTADFSVDGPLIMWNHRWEHDKDPESFFEALYALKRKGFAFRVSLCGQRFRQTPKCFERAQVELSSHLADAEPILSREGYLQRLAETDIVVSTALHEFFGISVLEATLSGACPIVPDRLVYPELYPAKYRYRDQAHLVKMLGALCQQYQSGCSLRADRSEGLRSYLATAVPLFQNLFNELTSCETVDKV